MQKEIQLALSPRQASLPENYKHFVANELGIAPAEIRDIKLLNRSIDARRKFVKVVVRLLVFYGEEPPRFEPPRFEYHNVSAKPVVIVVGSGPAGMFASLRLIELGLKPIVLERGKEVSLRKRDIAQLHRNSILNPDSNYCFGEGGAGTFSDGKLYTRSKKRGDVNHILNILHFHGASGDILIDSHPHIGSDRLPALVRNIRESILNAGGEYHFETKVNELIIKDQKIGGVRCENGKEFLGKAVILATGHSARDIYKLLHTQGYALKAKGFAAGVRVEHPQELIDSIQYNSRGRNPFLPPASYNLSTQVEKRGVYSFCMCPGGFIVPSATESGQLLVNGMSPSHRGTPFANSGIVVEIQPNDLNEFQEYGVFAGLEFQKKIEQMAFLNGGQSQIAPAQRLPDFVKSKLSPDLPPVSYLPGVISSPIHFWLPEMLSKRLQQAFQVFDKKMRGFFTREALVVGVESRTSSPVQIPRNVETLEHEQIQGLFPCGEGAGYAGGIVSSALDGQNCAQKVSMKIEA